MGDNIRRIPSPEPGSPEGVAATGLRMKFNKTLELYNSTNNDKQKEIINNQLKQLRGLYNIAKTASNKQREVIFHKFNRELRRGGRRKHRRTRHRKRSAHKKRTIRRRKHTTRKRHRRRVRTRRKRRRQ